MKNQVYTKHSINASLHEHIHITKVSIRHLIKTFRKVVCPFRMDAILDADAPALEWMDGERDEYEVEVREKNVLMTLCQ